MISAPAPTPSSAHATPAPVPAGRLDRVSKAFGSIAALDDVSLDFAAGRVTTLLGPNGAGKTTAVRILLGLTSPDAGQAQLFGRSPTTAAARARVGVMLQIARAPQALRVIEQVQLFSSYYPSPLAPERTIALAGLQGLERRLFARLSGGQQQRVLFALAICGNPDLLVLDEPTASLDVEGRRALWSAVRAWAARGSAVLLTTHDLVEAETLSDRVVVLQRGRVLCEGSPAEVVARTARGSISCVSDLDPARVREFPGVAEVERVGRTLRILTTTPEATAAVLLREDPRLTDLQVTRTRLEDAFVSLTR